MLSQHFFEVLIRIIGLLPVSRWVPHEIGSVRLSGHFLESHSLIFLIFGMVIETQMKLCVEKRDFSRKILLLKITFRFWHFSLKLFFAWFGLKRKFIWFLVPCANSMLEKILVLELWAKMLSIYQISGILNCHISRTNRSIKVWFSVCGYKFRK